MIKYYFAIFLSLVASVSMAQEIYIGAGKAGRGYDNWAQEAARELRAYSIPAKVKNFAGSEMIAAAVCSGDILFGPVQIDAIFNLQGSSCSVTEIGYYGAEQAFMLVPPDSKIKELSDLTKDHSVLIDKEGSGTALFWETIVSIENGPNGNKSSWSQAKPIKNEFRSAEGLSKVGKIDALIMVTKEDSETLRGFIDKGWSIANLYDKDINDQEFNGKPLYENSKVDLGVSWGSSDEGKSYKIESLIIAKENWEEQNQSIVNRVYDAAN